MRTAIKVLAFGTVVAAICSSGRATGPESVVAPTGPGVSVKSVLTLEGARMCMTAAQTFAREKGATPSIAVVDDGGNLVMVERMDGSFAAGANVSIGKARTSAIFKKPTKVFEDTIKGGRTTMLALNDFTPLQGGVPIVVEGQIVGAIGVSGAASAEQDEMVAMAGAAAVGR